MKAMTPVIPATVYTAGPIVSAAEIATPAEPATRPTAWMATTAIPPRRNSASPARKATSSAFVIGNLRFHGGRCLSGDRQEADRDESGDQQCRQHVPKQQGDEGTRRVDTGDAARDVDRCGAGRG